MLTSLFTLAAMFATILGVHHYMLEAIHKDALSKRKLRDKTVD